MGRLVTGCTADPSLVFVPTDLSILARCVTNVYVTTSRRKGRRQERREKRGKHWQKEERGRGEGKKSDERIVKNEIAHGGRGLEESSSSG